MNWIPGFINSAFKASKLMQGEFEDDLPRVLSGDDSGVSSERSAGPASRKADPLGTSAVP